MWERMALGFGGNVWSNVCKLDAVIDYRPLSLTARHMETVTVFRYAHTNMYALFSWPPYPVANTHQTLLAAVLLNFQYFFPTSPLGLCNM